MNPKQIPQISSETEAPKNLVQMSRQIRVPDERLKRGRDPDVCLLDDGDVRGLNANESRLGRPDEEADRLRVAVEALHKTFQHKHSVSDR
jgi:hypothetical protein